MSGLEKPDGPTGQPARILTCRSDPLDAERDRSVIAELELLQNPHVELDLAFPPRDEVLLQSRSRVEPTERLERVLLDRVRALLRFDRRELTRR